MKCAGLMVVRSSIEAPDMMWHLHHGVSKRSEVNV